MRQDAASRRRREQFVVIVLAAISGCGIFLFSLLVLQWYFLAFLAGIAVMALVGGLHYLLWGRRQEREERTVNAEYTPRPERLRSSANGIAYGTPKHQK
jgi:Zn-dependent protease with chaperone function